jgi:hypothetical protein
MYKPGGKGWSILRKLEIFSHYSLQDKLVIRDANNLSFIQWPNGAPCMVANLYMLSLLNRLTKYNRPLSRVGKKGGSIGTYAGKVALIVKYAFSISKDFIDFTDSDFTNFIDSLRHPNLATGKKRLPLSVDAIGRECIDFLMFVGRLYEDVNFIRDGGIINVKEKVVRRLGRDGREFFTPYWTHHSLATAGHVGEEHRRDPISDENIARLRAAVNRVGSSRFLKLRKHALLSVFSGLGPRRMEANLLRVEDVLEASSMKEPMLRLKTLKTDLDSVRLVPVTHQLVGQLTDYLVHRSLIIKSTIKKSNDHGFFFISSRTGMPLSEDSISTEIYNLRRAAGIAEQACAHMFRHAFCTSLFVEYISRHKIKSQDQFSFMLISDKSLKYKMTMWTGQKSIASFLHYVHIAFDRLGAYDPEASSVRALKVMSSYEAERERLLSELGVSLSVKDYKMQLAVLKARLRKDLAGFTDKRHKDLEVWKKDI